MSSETTATDVSQKNPEYSFAIDRNILTAMQLFQSPDKNRYILNSVWFEIAKGLNSTMSLTLVGTDGRRLAVYEAEIRPDAMISEEMPSVDQFAVDITGVTKLPKTKDPAMPPCIVTVRSRFVEFKCGKYTYRSGKVDGVYPNWRAVVPADSPTETKEIGLNSELLQSFGKAAKILARQTHLRLALHGTASVVGITFPKEPAFTGYLMPMITDEERAERDSAKATEAAA
jgi:DNA polymerase III sliding clamp (beta) subunit (PCNA family)